jgi:hypothetical protein
MVCELLLPCLEVGDGTKFASSGIVTPYPRTIVFKIYRNKSSGRELNCNCLDVARDVFQHHDGVVDDESNRNRQCHQRKVIERVAE